MTPGSATDPAASPTLAPGPGQGDATDSLTRTLLTATGQTQMTQAGGPTIDPGSEGSGALAAGEAFGARYRIDRLIGKGGMGAVYEAWDAELDVQVALKVIHPEQLADPETARTLERRFKRELLLGRRVTHKNVVRIHDIGEIFGIKYITMPFIEGDDLSTVMQNAGGKLPVPRALAIARTALSGLIAAHDAGVVHRDLKPANIMIDADDQAYIMDFGIALATSDTAESAEGVTGIAGRSGTHESELLDSRTQLGRVVGTVKYMAPEQGRGDTVDKRTDLYAFGLILYDMLVGKFRERTSSSSLNELTGRMKAAPPLVRSIEPGVPEALEEIINVCVQPDPEERYQNPHELEAALDRLDDEGNLRPIERRISPLQLSSAVAGVVALLGTIWWFTYTPPPAVQPDPVSVVIADLENGTGDSSFDGTLEPMIRRALEGAGFITAYDRTGVRILGVPPPDALDGVAARELAVNQGVGVVLSSSIDPQRNGYEISMTAMETITGNVIASAQRRASSKDQVLEVATNLVATVRRALGEDASESTQMFAMASLSATSLDVVGHYAAAQEAASKGQFEAALQSALKAVELDPEFGIGYQLLAAHSRNLGRVQDARKYIDEALRYLDGMTERERYGVRGFFYRMTGDYQQCVNEYGELIARYAADVVGHNQRALCLSKLRDMRGAVEGMRRVVDLLPSQVIFRDNLALYANYAGDFQMAEQEARTIQEPDAYTTLALAFAQLGQGQFAQAMATYQELEVINALGASFAASGLADLATFEGRFSDAVRILEQGAAAEVASDNPDRAAAKFAALAHTRLLQEQMDAAVDAADAALRNSQGVNIRFLAARVFAEAGDIDRARPLIAGLASELEAEPQAYAKIVEGNLAVKDGDARQAIQLLTEANDMLDTWIGRFDLGRAYLEAGALTQADSQFDQCLTRRGEALSLFLDEEPTYGYLPPVYYYQGRVREGLNTSGFTESYRTYLDIRGSADEDPLLSEVRERVEG